MSKNEHTNFAHCNGHGCLKKETCHRYSMHLKAREKELTWLEYLHPVRCQENDYIAYQKERK